MDGRHRDRDAKSKPVQVDDVAQRLRATKHFQKVEVFKRFGSIADP